MQRFGAVFGEKEIGVVVHGCLLLLYDGNQRSRGRSAGLVFDKEGRADTGPCCLEATCPVVRIVVRVGRQGE